MILLLDNINDSLTDPINVNNVEAVQKLIERYESDNHTLDSKQSDIDHLIAKAEELKGKGLDVSLENVTSKYNDIKKNAVTVKENLDNELVRQSAHDNLRKEFAERANTLDTYLNQITSKAANTEGALESQLATLNEINLSEEIGRASCRERV